MYLDALPTEILTQIFSYTNGVDVSLTNQRFRFITLPMIFGTIELDYPSERFGAICNIVERPGYAHCVQNIVLGKRQHHTTIPCDNGLLRLLSRLENLKSIQCHTSMADWLNRHWQIPPHCKIHLMHYGRSPEDSTMDYLLSMPNLCSLESYCCGYDELDFEKCSKEYQERNKNSTRAAAFELEDPGTRAMRHEMRKTLQYLACVAPGLKRLQLASGCARVQAVIPAGITNKCKLEHLDLSVLTSTSIQMITMFQSMVCFDKLISIALSPLRRPTMKWLAANPPPLYALQSLSLDVYMPRLDPTWVEYIIKFIKDLSPLGSLLLRGDHLEIPCNEIFQRHNDLHMLELGYIWNNKGHPCKWTERHIPLYQPWLSHVCSLHNLTKLEITVPRKYEKELNVWNVIRLSSVVSLTLVLDIFFDLGGYDEVHKAEVFKAAALDADLATSIFEFCRLEHLDVRIRYNDRMVFSYHRYYRIGDDLYCAFMVLRQLTRNVYRVSNVGGKSRVIERESEELLADIRDEREYDMEAMKTFHDLWPFDKNQQDDWKKKWHSFPLDVDVAA